MTEAPTSPKRRLIDLLTLPSETQRLCQFAGMVPDSLPLVRTALMLSGLSVPAETADPLAFVLALLHQGRWSAYPASLVPPEVGDLYVVTDAQKQVVEIGFVCKLPQPSVPKGQPQPRPEWFQALAHADGGERPQFRRQVLGAGEGMPHAVDFYVRIPGG